jgi:hypothetical protein
LNRRGLASLGLGIFLSVGSALAGVGLSAADAAIPTSTGLPARSAAPPTGAPAGNSPGAANADSGQDIRDIHGPIAIPGRRSSWWYAGVAAIAVGVLAAFAFYARRHKPIAPPHERALRALEEAGTMFEGDPRQFSFAVSEIVRQYVEEAFRVRAAHRTTEELLADLMLDRSPVAVHRAALGEFLRYCDLAKFAGWSLSPADRMAMLASAETFVRATATPESPEQVRRAAIRGEGIA